MSILAPATMPKTDREFMSWLQAAYDLRVMFGTGSPAGVVVANRGKIYLRSDGGAGSTFYVKESGDGTSAGWAAK